MIPGEAQAAMRGRDAHDAFLKRHHRVEFFNSIKEVSVDTLKGYIARIQEEIDLREKQEIERHNYNI